jgi:RNA polymerase sigma factor (sigma-70 family)
MLTEDDLNGLQDCAYSVVSRQGIEGQDREDIVQEVLLAIVAYQGEIENQRAFVRRVSQFKCCDYFRGQRKNSPLPPAEEVVDDAMNPPEALQLKEKIYRLDRAISELDARDRRVAGLLREGMTPRQIAQEMGVSHDAARGVIYRVTKKLQTALGAR